QTRPRYPSLEAVSDRVERVRARMAELGVDALLLSSGADLPWLIGYEATPLERLTMLVLPADSDATLVVPRLEAPRVEPRDWVVLRPWEETEDPIGIVAALVGAGEALAVSDQTWSRFVLALQAALPRARWQPSSSVTGSLRAGEDAGEIAALRRALAAAVGGATVGMPGEDVGGAARRIIDEAGYGPYFVHRTGHGIGVEAHEDPYLVGGNCEPLAAGHAFSIEPGIYLDGRWGARIEDIVVATAAGPDALNRVEHALVVVEA